MKKINEILNTSLNLKITNINDDSRKIKKNGVFFAIKGIEKNGNDYISEAIKNGAVCIVTSENIKCTVPVIKVINPQLAYNEALNKFYNNVKDKLKIISVTGTDGKTTVSEIIYQLINNYNKCGYIGTNGIRLNKFKLENEHTTPLPDKLYYVFNEFKKRNCKYVSIEASSERLATHKLDGVKFDVAIFTNLTRDHLNFHKTIENYIKAKTILFKNIKANGLGIINYDDQYKNHFINACQSKYLTYSLTSDKASLYATNIKVAYNNLEFDINGLYQKHIKTNLSGLFNVNNIMCAILALTHFGYSIESIVKNIEKLKPIESRQMLLKTKYGFNIMVDYAHTAGAIKNLYNYVKPLTKGKIIIVYGAIGARDPRRMIEVANFATENADYSIFTTDNIGYEKAESLMNLMISEVRTKNYELEEDRDKAIAKAIMKASKDDMILILGKGLENYQIINGKKIIRPNDLKSAKLILKKYQHQKKRDKHVNR